MSDDEQHLLVDTNLFFECLQLDKLPWLEIGTGTIVLIVTKPVLDEIHKHKKKPGGRTKSRALDIWQKVRTMVDAGKTEYIIQATGPKVIVRMAGPMPFDTDHEDHLDKSKPDDRLIGILSKAHKENPDSTLCFLTHDTGPASTAKIMGLPVKLIPDNWLRPPQVSDENKRIQDLEQTISKYQSQEPRFSISAIYQGEKTDRIKIIRKVPQALSSKEIDELIEDLKRRAPMKTDFEKPPLIKGIKFAVSAKMYDIEQVEPDPEAIKTYQTETYPAWIETCREVLSKLHEFEPPYESKLPLRFEVTNSGTRPAENARIEFASKGDVYMTRNRPKDDDDIDDEADITVATKTTRTPPKLPIAPKAPAWTTKKTLKAKPMVIKTKTPSSLLQSASALDAVRKAHDFTGLNAAIRAVQVPGFDSVLKQQRLYESIMPKSLLQQSLLDTYSRPNGIPEIAIPRRYIPPKHNKEGFYYDEWSPEIPTESGALTVDIWRHSNGIEVFDLNVHLEKETEMNGVIECRIQASNLTDPFYLKIPISLEVDQTSVTELAEKVIDDCAPLLLGKIYAADMNDENE